MGIEVEIKFKLSVKDYKSLKGWLGKNAKFVKKEHHIEHYLNNPEDSFKFKQENGFVDAYDYLRIRFAKDSDSICLKQFETDPKTHESINIGEFETNVDNGNNLLELMQKIGFTDNIIVDKKREKYNYKNFEIVIDDVVGLGKFAEVELKEDVNDYYKGNLLIKNFLKEIGFRRIKEQTRGYVSMLWNPDMDFSRNITL